LAEFQQFINPRPLVATATRYSSAQVVAEFICEPSVVAVE
jgi:hypothetical protein